MQQKRYLNIIIILLISFCIASCSDKKITHSALDKDAVILAFGDSLTYGTGADPRTQSYPAILSQLTGFEVVNAGIPGEISEYGLERLPSILEEVKPDLVILCHGGNDLIRKLDKQQLKSNLTNMITMIQAQGIEVVLIGVPSFSFTLAVPELYEELAETHQLPIELDILPRLERDPKVKSDHIHPNATGYVLFAEAVYQLLQTSGFINVE